jgi:hypothetical protein
LTVSEESFVLIILIFSVHLPQVGRLHRAWK